MPRSFPVITTDDGFIDPETMGDIHIDAETGAPTMTAHTIIELQKKDSELGLARDLAAAGLLEFIGKSGQSRVGLHARRNSEEVQIADRKLIVPLDLLSLRAVEVRRNGVRDELLSVFQDIVRERRRPISVGRILMAHPEDALKQGDVMDAIANHTLFLGDGVDVEKAVRDDGTVALSLEKLRFLFCEDNFDENAMRNVIRFGKHGIHGLQEPAQGLPDELEARQFFVGGIRISIGPFVAVIEPQATDPRVMHLAARILDGVRTSGIQSPRQVELFNMSLEDVKLLDLKVVLKLYHATREVQDMSDAIMNEHTIRHGVGFSEVVDVLGHPERIVHLMKSIAPTHKDTGANAILVGASKYREVKWQPTANFQETNLPMLSAKVCASEPEHCIFGDKIPASVQPVSSKLRYVGREQNEGHVCASWGFPEPRVMEQMLRDGNGVFIAHDLRARSDAYARSSPLLNEDRLTNAAEISHAKQTGFIPPPNDVYFDAQLFSAFQGLHAEGARFLMVRHRCEDAFDPGTELKAEVLEWDEKGFWLRPDAKEALQKIDTVISMYGSHVAGMEHVLKKQITMFGLRMKQRFGESIAFMHGKGPGVMKIADEVGEKLPELAKDFENFSDITTPIPTIGVGIDAERFGQSPNFHPPAQVDFRAKDRLIRQKHMNDRSTINIFNIGGAGTLEEIALTLCSQKLYKNIPSPMIFVDPAGFGENGKHLWAKLAALIEDLAARKEVDLGSAEQGKRKIQLLQSYWANFIHIVDSYEDAADIIENFANDPVKYYLESAKMPKSDLARALMESVSTFQETKFPMPEWLNMDRLLSDPRWEHSA